MNELEECEIQCPYCGEEIVVLIDCSVAEQFYIEDCQVCCAPIEFAVRLDQEGRIDVAVARDDE